MKDVNFLVNEPIGISLNPSELQVNRNNIILPQIDERCCHEIVMDECFVSVNPLPHNHTH